MTFTEVLRANEVHVEVLEIYGDSVDIEVSLQQDGVQYTFWQKRLWAGDALTLAGLRIEADVTLTSSGD